MTTTISGIEALQATLETMQLKEASDDIRKYRSEKFKAFQEMGFPTRVFEEYKYTPFADLLEKDVDFLSTPEEDQIPANEIQSVIAQDSGNRIVFYNGIYRPELSLLKEEDADLSVQGGSHGMPSVIQNDPFVLLNEALAEKSLRITAKNTKVNPVVSIYNFYDFRKRPLFQQPKLEIQVPKNLGLQIVERHYFFGSGALFQNSLIRADVRENASLNITKIQNFQADHILVENVEVNQKKDSRFYINTLSFAGKVIRNNLSISQDAEHCESYMNGLFLIGDKTHVDNHTSVDHKFPNSYSDELYKGILKDQARGVFNGKIFVRPGAQKTNAFQSNNNITLSDKAIINTKPQLEIWADDVKCSHGCTIGQLDQDAIFYLRARGLDEQSAKSMLLNAFAEDTLRHIPMEGLKEELAATITERLQQ